MHSNPKYLPGSYGHRLSVTYRNLVDTPILLQGLASCTLPPPFNESCLLPAGPTSGHAQQES